MFQVSCFKFQEIMAIVFIQSKKRRKMVFWIIAVLLILVLFIISLVTFPPGLKYKPSVVSMEIEKIDVKINFSVIDSELVKKLEPFKDITTDFIYTTQNKDGRQIKGKISAVSKNEAKVFLEGTGLKVLTLESVAIGRDEPFTIYYQPK